MIPAPLILLMSAAAAPVVSVPVPAPVSSTAPAVMTEPDPRSMTQRQIREFNATVSRTSPFYIRCVRAVDTGSLVRASYSCRTNRQWKAAEEAGGDNARQTWDAMYKNHTNEQ